jgi:hypothetical protein
MNNAKCKMKMRTIRVHFAFFILHFTLNIRCFASVPSVPSVSPWLKNYARDCRISRYSVSARSNGMLVSSGT